MTLPPNGFLALLIKDEVTKDPCYRGQNDTGPVVVLDGGGGS